MATFLRTAGIGLALTLASPASATWSIVAVDPGTRQVGAAGASCIVGSEVIAQTVPGVGVVVAQALSNLAARRRAALLIADGASPGDAIAAVTEAAADSALFVPTVRLRQYGAATLAHLDAPASFTGSWTIDWAGSRQGLGVSVQGNLLRGPEVVDEALTAYESAEGLCLVERLARALEAGAAAGGDRRCEAQLAAASAFIVVANPNDLTDAPGLSLVAQLPGRGYTGVLRELWRGLVRAQRSDGRAPVALLRDALSGEGAVAVSRLCETSGAGETSRAP